MKTKSPSYQTSAKTMYVTTGTIVSKLYSAFLIYFLPLCMYTPVFGLSFTCSPAML